MFLDNLLPSYLGAIAAPKVLLKRLQYPDLVSFGLLANLSKMRSKGIISGIDSIWDVGANQGQFAFMAHSVWPRLPIYSFEPDPESCKKLEGNFKNFSIAGRAFCCALGDKVESKQLMRYADGVNNSLLTRDQGSVLGQVTVECTSLDNVSLTLPQVNTAFLKLDVQGFELVVLAGASNFLERCRFVQVEVSFSPAYAEGAHAGEIILAMREYGFECIEILDLLRDRDTHRVIRCCNENQYCRPII
jgi:FkbM family methyltransferase